MTPTKPPILQRWGIGLRAFPVYYLANLVDTRPTTVPQVVLSDGNKTVVFQGMVHVGSEAFYNPARSRCGCRAAVPRCTIATAS